MGEDGGRCAFLVGEGEGNDLGVEAAGLLRGGGFAVGVERVVILLLAGDGMLFGDEFAGHAHVLIVAGAPEAVVDHGVDGLRVAHAKTFARGGKKVGRVGHGLHATGDGDLGVADGDGLGCEANGFEAGAADHVDGESGDGVGETTAQRGLARGILAEAGGEDAAHDALGDFGGIDGGAFDGGAHCDGSELDGGEMGECAEELADGGSGCTDDDYFTHEVSVISDDWICFAATDRVAAGTLKYTMHELVACRCWLQRSDMMRRLRMCGRTCMAFRHSRDG